MKYKYEITSQHGTHRSWHKTLEGAEMQRERNLGGMCGICGSKKGGWGRCHHGGPRICSAKHYNDRIISHSENQ